MINYLNIQNIGIIEDLTVEFEKGFNVLTGETGAGKTLIIDSLNLLSGQKFEKSKITTNKDFSKVEASISKKDVEYVIYRKVNKNGRNICKINGDLVTLEELKKFMEEVINIHGQNNTREILNESNQIEYVDKYIMNTNKEFKEIYNSYYENYINYKENLKELELLKKLGQNNLQRLDIIDFQIKEIESSNISIEEEKELEQNYDLAKNSEEIYESYEDTEYIFKEILPKLSDLMDVTNILGDFKEGFKSISNIVSNSYYELEEAFAEAKKIGNSITEYSKADISKLEDRIDTYNTLQRKYGKTTKDVLDFLEKIKEEKDRIENRDDKLNYLEEKVKNLKEKLEEESRIITKIRKDNSKNITKLINDEFKDLEMKGADLKINIEDADTYNDFGKDKIEFVIRTNIGDIHKPLFKIASGGEMSRIMLAIKKVFTDIESIPIIVFDEIDTGISGKVGQKVGIKMKVIAKNRQVLCVTHLPTIAALGDNNYYINKKEENDVTRTYIEKLTEEETIKEVARIASGKVTKEAIENAKILRNEKENI